MTVLVELPRELRGELKDPFGPIYTDADALLADAGDPVVAVGDVVTYHLLQADCTPDVAIIDGKTKREAVDERIREGIEGFDHRVELANPAATLTAAMLRELGAALARAGSTVIVVTEGEEDLAAVPTMVAAPDGTAVVYGQPDEGMVLATVDADLRARMRDLLERMDGDAEAAWDALGVR
ncbi:MAG: GTP-dependent dephospho-CoA kinase family protein [Haloarculaceae archaeon]